MKWKIESYGEVGADNRVWLSLESLEAYDGEGIRQIKKEDMPIGTTANGKFRSSGVSFAQVVRTE